MTFLTSVTLIPNIPTIHRYLLTIEESSPLSVLTKLLPTALRAIINSCGLVNISWQRHLRAPKPDCCLSPGMSCCAPPPLSVSGWDCLSVANLTHTHRQHGCCSSWFLPLSKLVSVSLSPLPVSSLIFWLIDVVQVFHVCMLSLMH